MQIREIMTSDPEACLPFDTCAQAGAVMRRRRCGFVPVIDSHLTKRVVGVVTDRDLALYLTGSRRLADQTPVEACMTRAVQAIAPSASLDEAAKLMERAAVHRLPVVEADRLIGVLSLKDIAVAADKRWGFAESRVAEQKLGEIIEAIAAAR